MTTTTEIHPGLAALRVLIPSDDARWGFVGSILERVGPNGDWCSITPGKVASALRGRICPAPTDEQCAQISAFLNWL